MASTFQPNILAYKCDAALAKGVVVKVGTDSEHVAVCSAASDKSIGITQGTTTTAEDVVEVAVAGGGAKAKAGGTIAVGDMLTADASGFVIATTSNADKVIGQALEDAASGDLVSVMIVPSIA